MAELTANGTVAVSEENKAKAEALKNEANKQFAAKKYNDAIKKYNEAINLNPNVAAYFANRSFSYTKTELYGYAILDADKAIELDPTYVKGYYRRAIAHMALSKFKSALTDFRIVTKKAPNDKDAHEKLKECEKIVRKAEFEKAIQFDENQVLMSEKIDVNGMIVEDNYDGPHIENDQITEAFMEAMIARFRAQKKIHRKYAFQIVLAVRKFMLETPSLVDITIPDDATLTVCGDIHGQFYDLLNILEKISTPPNPKHLYLFNGDFVDRGSFSLEVVLTLFGYKWLYPDTFFLARGNHETDNMNKVYGFEGEVKSKFSESMFKVFSETFAVLPLAHLIQKKILCLHGGLFSRDDVTLDEIKNIDRFSRGSAQPGSEGLMVELLWSDPQETIGRGASKRGVGVQFGPDVTEKFLKLNNLSMLIRSHEVKENGYLIEHNGKCVTVFSAPNYCDTVGNKGALINITPDLSLEYKTFEAVPHPNVKPMQYASGFGGMFI